MLLISTVFVIGLLGPVMGKEDVKCNVAGNERLDEIMAKLITIGEYGRRYPENSKQLKPFCK